MNSMYGPGGRTAGALGTDTCRPPLERDVIGTESVVRAERCPFDLHAEGPGGLAAFLDETPR